MHVPDPIPRDPDPLPLGVDAPEPDEAGESPYAPLGIDEPELEPDPLPPVEFDNPDEIFADPGHEPW